MKTIKYFLLFVLLAETGSLKGQDETLLKNLGEAPLANHIGNKADLRRVLREHNGEIWNALDFFPGGELGEEVYINLYESIDNLPIWKEKIPIGQKFYWMLFKNGRLKNVRWMGNDPIDAFVFEVRSSGKIFKFAAPLRCGNISLVSMREIPAEKVQSERLRPQPRPRPRPRPYPQPRSQPRPQPRPQSQPRQSPKTQPQSQPQPAPPSAPLLELAPVPASPPPTPLPLPKIRLKIGAGWNKMQIHPLSSLPSLEDPEEKTDFFSLIPKEDDFFYYDDGTAGWLYTPGGKGSPFTSGQKIDLKKQINNFKSQQGGVPFFIGVEGQILSSFYIEFNFFHLGKINIQYEKVEETMLVNEMRFLGNYEIDNVDVYYVGFDRQRNESTVDEEVSVNEVNVEAKYEKNLSKDFSILPLVGLSWQIERSQLEVHEEITRLYPFREEVISTEEFNIPSEKISKNYFHPYLGMEIEVSYFFLRGKYCFGDFSKQYNSSWEIQGGILIKY